MHDAARVSRDQRARDLNRESDRFTNRHHTAVEPPPQRLTVNELADDERPAVEIAEIVDHQNVRMVQRGRGASLRVEPAQTIGIRGGFRRQQLQRDVTIQLRVVRLVDFAHGAGADTRHDAIALHGPADQRVCRPIDQRRGRRFEKRSRTIVRQEHRIHLLPQWTVGAAHAGKVSRACSGIHDDRGIENRLDARPVDGRRAHRPPNC